MWNPGGSNLGLFEEGGAGGIAGLLCNAAHVLAADDADVALLAPRLAPGVLNVPVVEAVRQAAK